MTTKLKYHGLQGSIALAQSKVQQIKWLAQRYILTRVGKISLVIGVQR